jgi:hypothetical protein
VRRLSIALSAAALAAGVFAAPVGGGSSTVKPAVAKAGKTTCLKFEF